MDYDKKITEIEVNSKNTIRYQGAAIFAVAWAIAKLADAISKTNI